MKPVNSLMRLALLLVCLLALAPPVATAIPPGGAQYGVGIPTPNGPSTPTGDPIPQPRNLPPPSDRAIDDLGTEEDSPPPATGEPAADSDEQPPADPPASRREQRQLRIVGSSQQLGAPARVDTGPTSGGRAVVAADLASRESPGFLTAATGALGGFPAPLVLALLITTIWLAASARAGHRRGAGAPRDSPGP